MTSPVLEPTQSAAPGTPAVSRRTPMVPGPVNMPRLHRHAARTVPQPGPRDLITAPEYPMQWRVYAQSSPVAARRPVRRRRAGAGPRHRVGRAPPTTRSANLEAFDGLVVPARLPLLTRVRTTVGRPCRRPPRTTTPCRPAARRRLAVRRSPAAPHRSGEAVPAPHPCSPHTSCSRTTGSRCGSRNSAARSTQPSQRTTSSWCCRAPFAQRVRAGRANQFSVDAGWFVARTLGSYRVLALGPERAPLTQVGATAA